MTRQHRARNRWRPPGTALLFAGLLSVGLAFANIGSAAPGDSANLRITKDDSPDPISVGAVLTYTIGVENRGPSPATGVTVTDTLPRGVDLVSASGPSGDCAVSGRKVTCPVGALSPTGVKYGGSPATVTIGVMPQRIGTLRNTATVSGVEKDPASGNNRTAESTRVIGARTCRGAPATASGTAGSDVLVGTAGPDVIVALGGHDQIISLSGRDLVCAGPGNDFVGAGTAADRVFAGPGRDRLVGRGGPDLLKGSAGNDVLKGNGGSDRLRGGNGFDRCRGGAGSDSTRGCER